MAFARVNPLGWALFEELTSAQMNQLDLNASRAIDGTFGGTYNPSAPITINGTLTVTNLDADNITNDSGTWIDLTVTNDLTSDGTSTFNGQTVFNDPVTFNSTQQVNGTVTQSSGSYLFTGAGTLLVSNGFLSVAGSGTALFSSDVRFQTGSDVLVEGSWEFDGAVVTVDLGTSWVFENAPQFDNGFDVTSGLVDATGASGFRLPASVTKYGGAFIEYDTARSVFKQIPIQSYVIRRGTWSDFIDYLQKTAFDGGNCWFAIPIPRRTQSINSVSLYFNCSDNPASDGIELSLFAKTAQGSRTLLGNNSQPLGSHAGDNILTINGPFTINGSTSQLLIEVAAPVGNVGSSTTELHGFNIDLNILGIGSW